MTPQLEAAYRQPHRRYHTLAHVQDCLARLARVEGLAPEERRILELAIWWHDAVYEPLRADNEARSAELALDNLEALGEPSLVRAEVARLILLTAGHEVDSDDRLGAVLVSIDLAILGASPTDYDLYALAIREEYAQVPDPLYRAGRGATLRRFLQRAIFPDPGFAAELDGPARANIERELELLAA
ncbi:MAG: phosphohydrolase [Proteobacteria bacterium]|nr:phosphohydrolase [Pseudomonadota bacterium]